MNKLTIKYLIKFVTEEEHAISLQKGHLFMRPVEAYIKMYYDEYFKQYNEYTQETFYEFMKTYQGCIGDVREGLLYENAFIRACTNVPILCLTYVTSNQVIENADIRTIVFDKRLIDEFNNSNYKYLLVIDFENFINNIENYITKNDGFYGYSPVYYKNRNSQEIIKDCFENCSKGKNLFYKNPIFYYQQEFRLFLKLPKVKYSPVTYKTHHEIYEFDIDDKEFKNGTLLSELPYDNSIKIDSLESFSKIHKMSEIVKFDDKYILNLELTNE